MARFPKTEAEIVALADAMVSGLVANAATYPTPPVAPVDLTALVSTYYDRKKCCYCSTSGGGRRYHHQG